MLSLNKYFQKNPPKAPIIRRCKMTKYCDICLHWKVPQAYRYIIMRHACYSVITDGVFQTTDDIRCIIITLIVLSHDTDSSQTDYTDHLYWGVKSSMVIFYKCQTHKTHLPSTIKHTGNWSSSFCAHKLTIVSNN